MRKKNHYLKILMSKYVKCRTVKSELFSFSKSFENLCSPPPHIERNIDFINSKMGDHSLIKHRGNVYSTKRYNLEMDRENSLYMYIYSILCTKQLRTFQLFPNLASDCTISFAGVLMSSSGKLLKLPHSPQVFSL